MPLLSTNLVIFFLQKNVIQYFSVLYLEIKDEVKVKFFGRPVFIFRRFSIILKVENKYVHM